MFGDGPTLSSILWTFLGLGIAGFALSFVRWWAPLPIILVLAAYGTLILGEFSEPDLYPEYTRVYPNFIPTAVAAIFVGVMLPAMGTFLRLWRGPSKSK